MICIAMQLSYQFFFFIVVLYEYVWSKFTLQQALKSIPFVVQYIWKRVYVQTSTNLSAYNREQKFVRPAHFVNITIHNLQLRLSLFSTLTFTLDCWMLIFGTERWGLWSLLPVMNFNDWTVFFFFFGVFLLILKGGKLCQYVITKISVYHL